MRKKKTKAGQQAPTPPDANVVPFTSGGRVQVGDIVMRQPISFSDTDSKNAQLMRGVVVWVHPKGRFHVVEFGKGVRESFPGVSR